jgi:hypothetical protein
MGRTGACASAGQPQARREGGAVMATEIPLLAYEQVRPLIQSGDLLLCQGQSIFARLIRHATGSDWSHVGCVLRVDTIERLLVFESVESIGVRAVPLSQYISNYNGTGEGYKGRVFLARHAAFSPEMVPAFTAFSQRALDLLGSAYDTKSILQIAARVLAVDVGYQPRAIGSNATFICSEYCWEIYKAFGITLPYAQGGYIAPCDFATNPEVTVLWEVEVSHGGA